VKVNAYPRTTRRDAGVHSIAAEAARHNTCSVWVRNKIPGYAMKSGKHHPTETSSEEYDIVTRNHLEMEPDVNG